MKQIFTLLITLTFCFLASAQKTTDTLDIESEKSAVINLVEQFLKAAGNHDLDTILEMFSDKANIAGASLREGKWFTQ